MPVILKGGLELLPRNHGLTVEELDSNNWSALLTKQSAPYYYRQINIYCRVILGIRMSDFLLDTLADFMENESKTYAVDNWFYFRIVLD